jgi:hypothetical protein
MPNWKWKFVNAEHLEWIQTIGHGQLEFFLNHRLPSSVNEKIESAPPWYKKTRFGPQN